MPLHFLDRIDFRRTAGQAEQVLNEVNPARIEFDLRALDLRQSMWSLPSIDAFASRFPSASCDVLARPPARELLRAHLEGRTGAATPCLRVIFAPRASMIVAVEGLELTLPLMLRGSNGGHLCARRSEPAAACGLEVSPLAPALELTRAARREARDYLLSIAGTFGGPLIVVVAGSDPSRSWSHPSMRAAVGQLRERIGGIVVQVEGPAIHSSIRQIPPLHPCVMAAFVALSAVCMGDDTGWAHVAAAVKAPVVTVHGRTDPDLWGPVGHGTGAAYTADCSCGSRTRRCLVCLRPEPVVELAEKLAAERWPWDRIARWRR